jgi:hypothetical protein
MYSGKDFEGAFLFLFFGVPIISFVIGIFVGWLVWH